MENINKEEKIKLGVSLENLKSIFDSEENINKFLVEYKKGNLEFFATGALNHEELKNIVLFLAPREGFVKSQLEENSTYLDNLPFFLQTIHSMEKYPALLKSANITVFINYIKKLSLTASNEDLLVFIEYMNQLRALLKNKIRLLQSHQVALVYDMQMMMLVSSNKVPSMNVFGDYKLDCDTYINELFHNNAVVDNHMAFTIGALNQTDEVLSILQSSDSFGQKVK